MQLCVDDLDNNADFGSVTPRKQTAYAERSLWPWIM